MTNDRLWFVARDDDDCLIPKAAYPNRLLAEASAYLANKDGYGEYFAQSIPLLSTLPRIEHARRITVFLAEDGERLVSRNRTESIVHLDPEEADETPVIKLTHERSWAPYFPSMIRGAAIKIEASGTDHEMVEESIAAREHWLRKNWMPAQWTATYDVIADTGPTRRRKRTFEEGGASIPVRWLAERWQAEKIGPVQIEHWPTGERIAGNDLEKLLQSALTAGVNIRIVGGPS